MTGSQPQEPVLRPPYAVSALDDAAQWLAAAADDPTAVLATWARSELALIPTGIRFDVIRVLPGPGRGALRELLGSPHLGPVMFTRPTAAGFLVPVGPARSSHMA